MIVVEKVLKCNSFYGGYGGLEEIACLVADEVEKGWHIVNIERELKLNYRAVPMDPDTIITLRKGFE